MYGLIIVVEERKNPQKDCCWRKFRDINRLFSDNVTVRRDKTCFLSAQRAAQVKWERLDSIWRWKGAKDSRTNIEYCHTWYFHIFEVVSNASERIPGVPWVIQLNIVVLPSPHSAKMCSGIHWRVYSSYLWGDTQYFPSWIFNDYYACGDKSTYCSNCHNTGNIECSQIFYSYDSLPSCMSS